MKKYLICTCLFTLLFLNGRDLISQTIVPDAMADLYQKFDNYELLWYPNGTTYCTYNGDLFMFVWTEEHQGAGKSLEALQHTAALS